MAVIYRKDPSFELELDKKEKRFLGNAMDLVIFELAGELATRTGFSKTEYNSLHKCIIATDNSFNYVSKTQLLMLHQLLNEICHGIHIDNFESRLGYSLDEAEKMFSIPDQFI